jgi:putative glutamine amidotransferase
MTAQRRPLVGFPADTYEEGGHLYHSVGDKYLRAVAEVAGCIPMVIPAMADAVDIDAVLDHLDGVLMTGAVSNVHPPRYGEVESEEHGPYDLVRDDLTLRLIRACLARGLPLFCICRGFQELNVALGGTLEGELQRSPGRLDHRVRDVPDVDVRYGPVHAVHVTPDGMLERILGRPEIMVNSLHRQGIARLADGLAVEARAPDGVIEAVSVRGAAGFALGTQWHPEWKAAGNPDSVRLFTAFGDAVRAHHERRRASE